MNDENLNWIFLLMGGSKPALTDVKYSEIDVLLEQYYIKEFKKKNLMN